jgi:ferredoxin
MCEFCVQHGEGQAWYLNRRNYSFEVAREHGSLGYMKHFLETFDQSMFWDKLLLQAKSVGWLHRLMYRVCTAAQRVNHFGQVVSLEDAKAIIRLQPSIVRLPCPCKRLLTGETVRRCIGIGWEVPGVLSQVPEYDYEHLREDEALALLDEYHDQRLVHSVWTFKTPFIAAICNCDEDCMAMRLQQQHGLMRLIYPGHECAWVNWQKCNGCGKCVKACPFGAMTYFRTMHKATVEDHLCHGCGVCETVCDQGAITLTDAAEGTNKIDTELPRR